MRAAIDKAGRLVIPKALRDIVGLGPGEVEATPDGAGLRIEPIASDHLQEEDGLLVGLVGREGELHPLDVAIEHVIRLVAG